MKSLSCGLVVLTLAVSSNAAERADEPDLATISNAIVRVTNDHDANVRLAAYAALGDVKPTAPILQAFRRGLRDDDAKVRRIALSQLVDAEGASDEIIKLLVSHLSDPATADLAANKLVEIGEPAVPLLTDAVTQDETNVQAIPLLGKIRLGEHRSEAINALIASLSNEANEIRLEATRALGDLMKTTRRENLGGSPMVNQLIERYDKNEDGVLTEDEWHSFRRSPRLADANRDGRITADEFTQWIQRGGRFSP